jgi:hypothetical protein
MDLSGWKFYEGQAETRVHLSLHEKLGAQKLMKNI